MLDIIKKFKVYISIGVISAVLIGATAAYVNYQSHKIESLRVQNHTLVVANASLQHQLKSQEQAYKEEFSRWQSSMNALNESMKRNQQQINNLTGAINNAKHDEKTKECFNFELPSLVVDRLFNN